MRRARRSRIGRNRAVVVARLVALLKDDEKAITALGTGNRNYAFGKLLHKWIDHTRESVIDRYIDSEAKDVTNYAINIVNKQITEGSLAFKVTV